MWTYIFYGMCAATLAGIIYLSTRFTKSTLIMKALKGRKLPALLIGFIVTIAAAGIIYKTMGVWNTAFIFMHVLFFFVIFDAFNRIFTKSRSRQPKYYVAGILAAAVSVIYLGSGWYFAHHVVQTNYEITADKDLGVDSLRIVGFADAHLGSTFDYDEFEEYVDEMNAQKPDIFVIVGDYVDDDSSRENMEKCCEALGKIDAKYGVYYVYGNHDGGYAPAERGYTDEELIGALEDNGVKVLADENVYIDGNVYLIGRSDRRYPRREISELNIYDDSIYTIVLNHQPNDYDNEEAAGVDLVISGHTHGGQAIPINYLCKLFKLNDQIYGCERRGNTDFIVSSGISDWEFKFKTGCISEYFVIDIRR